MRDVVFIPLFIFVMTENFLDAFKINRTLFVQQTFWIAMPLFWYYLVKIDTRDFKTKFKNEAEIVSSRKLFYVNKE